MALSSIGPAGKGGRVPPFGGGFGVAGGGGGPDPTVTPTDFARTPPPAGLAGIGSPLTRDLDAARFGVTERLNVTSIVGSATDGAGWTRVTVSIPTVLMPLSILRGPCFYTPKIPPVDPYSASLADDYVLRARGPGVMYLWAPGDWYVKHDTGASVDFLQVPATDPTVAVQLLSLPGCQGAPNISTMQASAAAGVPTTIAANRRRQSLIIQNTSADANAVVRIGYVATPTATAIPADTDTGLALTQWGHLTLAGDTLSRDDVVLVSGLAYAVNWLELIG